MHPYRYHADGAAPRPLERHVSDETTEPGHGNSPASWAAVIVMLVGFTVGTIAFIFDQPIVVWASVGIVLLGLVVGAVLKRLGYGVGGSRVVSKGH